MSQPPIRFGTAYYPDHWPASDWERDLKLIGDSGLSTVRFGEFSWSWFEPRDGMFDLAAYDRFMDLAGRCGLDVILCTPTCNPPPWLLARYPDARQIDQKGRPHVGHRHQACYNHPAARALAERAVRKLAGHYRDHPALVGWQIDNELTAGESASPAQVYDYHPQTIRRYREHLKEAYGSLDVLNEAWVNNFWGNRYGDWDEIDPPRIGENRAVSPGMWLAWSRFRDHNVAALGQWQLGWLREVDPSFRIGTNVPETGPLHSVWLGQDYWAIGRGMDFVGTDLYVYQDRPEAEQRALAYSCDLIRSAAHAAGAEFGVLETQAGPHIVPWRMTFAGGMWEPDFLKRCVQTYAAHGARHILFFLWRAVRGGAEFGMNGLAQIDGSPSLRTAALPGIIAAGQAARGSLGDRPVAYIHYSQDSLRLGALYDPDHVAVTALSGWHGLLSDLGYRIEFLNDEMLSQIESLPAGPLVLPYSMSLSEELCRVVAQAVEGGRLLAAGFATAFFDQHGRIYLRSPGGGLDDALGVRLGGFDADRPLATAGFSSRGSILQVQLALACGTRPGGTCTGGRPLARSADGRTALAACGNAHTVAFDLGTLYQRASAEEQERIRGWVRDQIGL